MNARQARPAGWGGVVVTTLICALRPVLYATVLECGQTEVTLLHRQILHAANYGCLKYIPEIVEKLERQHYNWN